VRRYSTLQAVWRSFGSRSLYRDVALYWSGSGLLYLLVLLAVCAVPVTLAVHLRTFAPLAATMAPLVEQLPPIRITDGQVSVDAPQPYRIRSARTGRVVAIIDTTGKVTSLEGTTATLLLTRTRLFARQSDGEIVGRDVATLPLREVDRQIASRWLWWLRGPLALLLYAVFLLLAYAYLIAQGIVCAGVVLLLLRRRRREFSYHTALRLASVAATPAVLVVTAAVVAGVRAPLLLWLAGCFVVTLAYVLVGVSAGAELRGSDLGASPDVPSFTPH